MRKNFLIVDNYSLEYKSKSLDLHNEFDIEKIIYEPSKRVVIMRWIRSDKQANHLENIQNFYLLFNSVTIFKIAGGFANDLNINDVTLSYLGYLHPDDIEQMNGCLLENEANESFHMVFAFESGLFIKIFAESAEVIEKGFSKIM